VSWIREPAPLPINPVAVPGTGGIIGMAPCPGKVLMDGLARDRDQDLEADLGTIRDWGAQAIVTLMEAHELETCRIASLPDRVPAGIRHFHLPIPDGGIPDADWERDWQRAGPAIRALLERGGKVLVHCLGGLGRTGTVSARLLVEFGLAPEQAMLAVRAARRGAIENSLQEGYVRRQRPLPPHTTA
jgi:hypothetical protein